MIQGIILWIAMSVLVTTVCNVIFRLSLFTDDKKSIKDIKILTAILISEVVSISYVILNHTYGLFGLWGITIYPIEDAVLSGILISGGADFIYQIYSSILSFKEKLKTETEQIKAQIKE